MSVLAHVVLGGPQQSEPAATQALAYVLKSNPDIARAFVRMIRDAGVEFEPGRIEAELAHEESQPDLTIHDTDGHVRIFVENKFWAPLTKAQPVSYLESLPEDTPSALVFVVPEQRISTVWQELKERCIQADLQWADAPGSLSVVSARIGGKALLITSWDYVLTGLLDAAREGNHDAVKIRNDLLQLQGLTTQMESDAFRPLRDDEVTDQEAVRRLISYIELIDGVVNKLVEDGIADVKGLNRTATFYYIGRFFRMYGKFELWLVINFRVWRDHGITPLWLAPSGNKVTELEKIRGLFENVEFGGLRYFPIRLKTGVERDRVIDDAVAQMKRIGDNLLEKVSND